MSILAFLGVLWLSDPDPNIARQDELNSLRLSFHLSVVDEENIETFYSLTKNIAAIDATYQSYIAAGYVMKAKIDWNPIERIALVLRYRHMIDEAVKNEPNNVEARFMRFSIAYYLPDILGLKKNMAEDKDAILNNLYQFEVATLDPMFNHFIIWFVEHCGYFDDVEIDQVKCFMDKA